jgi:prolipoprotein diacylglyceryltransferase
VALITSLCRQPRRTQARFDVQRLAINRPNTHIRRMRTFGATIVVAVLVVLLGASLWYAVGLWTTLEDADMPVGIYIAMAGGILFSLAVGIGLMALVFYSNRAGYDERAAKSDFND